MSPTPSPGPHPAPGKPSANDSAPRKIPVNACRHCAAGLRDHFQRWSAYAGWHDWTAPTQEQIKQRMIARRAARIAKETDHPAPSVDDSAPREEIRIRWRRHGEHGGRWRAELPPGNGVDSGNVESNDRDTVERIAAVIADRYGYPIVRATEQAALDQPEEAP